MGHKSQEGSSTGEFYERFDPEFLEDAKEATDLVIREINRHLKEKSLVPRATETGTKNVITGRFGA